MDSSEMYAPIMATVHEKIYLSKASGARLHHSGALLHHRTTSCDCHVISQVVIEFCEQNPDGTYEDLLNKIEVWRYIIHST